MKKLNTFNTFSEAANFADKVREDNPKAVLYITTTEGEGFTWYQVFKVTGEIWQWHR